MSDNGPGIAELLLGGLVALQEEQVVRAEDPELRSGVEQWFADTWPDQEILGSGNYVVPRGGASNEMLEFDVSWRADGAERTERFVLRFEGDDEPIAPPACDPPKRSVDVEYGVQDALARSGGSPAVPLVGLEPTGDALDRPFYVMYHLKGRVPPTAGQNVNSFLVDEVSAAERETLMRGGLEAMAGFHRMDWRAAGLDWLYADQATAVTRQLALYREMTERYLRGAEHPTLMAALDWLDQHAPEPEPLSLTWGDARPGNIMFDGSCEVEAVLDWELAALLPPSMDLGHWMLADYMVHETEGTTRLPGVPTREEQLSIYEDALGREARHLGYWEVFAAAKSAYVFIRVVRRMQDKGVMPAEGDALFYNNFATVYLEERVAGGAPGLLDR
jgi:aminoglycoside phosphotransferase (APT) family kinase protein